MGVDRIVNVLAKQGQDVSVKVKNKVGKKKKITDKAHTAVVNGLYFN